MQMQRLRPAPASGTGFADLCRVVAALIRHLDFEARTFAHLIIRRFMSRSSLLRQPESSPLNQPGQQDSFVRELSAADRQEARVLLARDPLRGIYLHALIDSDGLCSQAGRGRFFGCFSEGELQGVALLGHTALIYTLPETEATALFQFAQTAADIRMPCHLILGPCAQVETFFSYLALHGWQTRLVSTHLSYASEYAPSPPLKSQLCHASLNELEAIASANSELARQASGTDPGWHDAAGYRQRIAERIRRRQIWVKMENRQMVFKAEVALETELTAYLEGVWTHPDWRNRGLAKSCLSELMHRLLCRHQRLCLLVELPGQAARRVYEQIGFVFIEAYQARYLLPLPESVAERQ